MPKERTPKERSVVSSTRPLLVRRRCEEGGFIVAPKVVGEDAREGAPREEVGEEELVGVDDGAPHAADPTGLGQRAAGELAEDIDEHVVGEADAVAIAIAIGPVHLARPASRRGCRSTNSEKAPTEGSRRARKYE